MSVSVGALPPQKLEKFKAWLAHNGAEVLAPTNEYEVVRFLSGSDTCVIYRSDRGNRWKAVGGADVPLDEFRTGGTWKAPIPKTAPTIGTRYYSALVQRDGRECFYCGNPVAPEDSSLEHIVPRSHGGPNHMANFALAHRQCNSDAGNLSAAEKVKLRDQMRATLAKHGGQ